METLKLKNLIRLIHEEQKNFDRYESELYNILMNRGASWYHDSENQQDAYELDEQESAIEESYRLTIEFIYSSLMTLMELMSLNDKKKALIQKVEKIRKEEGGKFQIHFNFHLDFFDCKSLNVLNSEVKIISSLLGEVDKKSKEEDKEIFKEETHRRLIRHLEQTGFYISALDISPTRELDVQKVMRAVLEGDFGEDYRPKPSISQPFKTFEPDGGIKSIETAIEFKFIDSAGDLKTAMDGIYTDFAGYTDSKDWNKFISIFYMTDNYRSPKTIEADILKKTNGKWRVISVMGKGARQATTKSLKKTTANSAK